MIHDFDRGAGEDNWSLMHGDNPVIISLPDEGEFNEVGVTFSRESSIIPLTLGIKQKPEGEVYTCTLLNCSIYYVYSHSE